MLHPSLATLTVASEAGTASGDTKITVTETLPSGHIWKYKVANAATSVTWHMNVSTWSTWDGTSDITAASGKVLTLVDADADKKAVGEGHVTVVAAE